MPPIIVAHRGLHARYPENSEEALGEAERLHIPWVECDVWDSAEHAPVVIHDETLDRTTEGSGAVHGFDWGTLSRTRLKTSVNFHCYLPTLFSTRWLRARTGLLVEVKPRDNPLLVARVIEALSGRARPWIIQSFDEANLHHVVAADARVPVALLVDRAAMLSRAADGPWAAVHARHDLLTGRVVRNLRAAGKRIGAWTVNEDDEVRRCNALGVDMLITDRPLSAAAALGVRLGNR